MIGKFIGAAALATLYGTLVMAQSLTPLTAHPDGIAWPTETWPQASLAPDIAVEMEPLLDRAMVGEKTDVMGETRAVVVIHRGQLVAERYGEGFGPDTKQVSWSMAKSITSALVGRAVHSGLVEDIDAPMPTPFAADDPRAATTWRQWLTMTDGLDYTEIGERDIEQNDVVQMMFGRGRDNVLGYVTDELAPLHPPGEVWNYSTAAYHLIGRALQTSQTLGACSRRANVRNAASVSPVTSCAPEVDTDMARWIAEQLFVPIGMDAQPEFDPHGTFLGGSLIWASPRDFAKFGYLYLRDGVWEDERLLSEGWVDFSRSKSPAKNVNVYGAGWWITAYGQPLSHPQNAATPPWDAFHAGGHEGQTIWVVPSRDLVIVRLGLMSNTPENWSALYEWNQALARAFPEAP